MNIKINLIKTVIIILIFSLLITIFGINVRECVTLLKI